MRGNFDNFNGFSHYKRGSIYLYIYKPIDLFINFSYSLKLTLDYLINVHGRLLFSEKISRMDALIRWWTLINFLAKFQGGRLFQVDAY